MLCPPHLLRAPSHLHEAATGAAPHVQTEAQRGDEARPEPGREAAGGVGGAALPGRRGLRAGPQRRRAAGGNASPKSRSPARGRRGPAA